MRISDWSSDVGSSDLHGRGAGAGGTWRYGYRIVVRGRGSPVLRIASGGVIAVSAQLQAAPGTQPEGTGSDVTDRHSARSEERRVGKEWVRTCRSRGSPSH